MERTLQRTREVNEVKSKNFAISDILFILSGPALLTVIIYLFLDIM